MITNDWRTELTCVAAEMEKEEIESKTAALEKFLKEI